MIISRCNLIFLLFMMALNAQKSKIIVSQSQQIDEYYGKKIVDDYRNLENLNDSSTVKWLKEETTYSKSILEKIPNREFYIDKRLEFDRRKSFSVYQINITENGFYFYLLQKPEEKTANIYYREGFNSPEIQIFNTEDFNKQSGKVQIINYIKPNSDGSKVVIALTEKGEEISEMVIYDVKEKKLLPDKITNSWPSDGGGISWLPDNKNFIYLYYPETDPKSNLFLRNMASVLYRIDQKKENIEFVFSKKNNPEIDINTEDFPIVNLPDNNSKYLLGYISGAANFQDTYFKPLKDLSKNSSWKLLFSKEEKISRFIVKNEDIIFVSEKNHKNAVYTTSLKNPDFSNPSMLVPSIKDETINGIYNIKDGFLFTTSRNGIEAKLYLYKKEKSEVLNLPFTAGDISVTTKDSKFNDFWIICSGWKNEDERFRYDYAEKKFVSENLSPVIQYPEFKDLMVKETTVKSWDGQDIPLTLIYYQNISLDSNNPVLIDAYGAYGTSMNPFFAKTYLLWALKGGVAAAAHVRGGGEKGEKWHEGGYKETKPNSWKDLISCAEYLVKEKYTSPSKMAMWGASAGGITIGRAMTERPNLFKAVIIESGILNPLRIESMPNGLNSVKEFGSIQNENEFKGLMEMDAYHHVKKNTKYPATLITTGINDPRVSTWMPAKFAAKLQADNISDNPILLNVDFEGGHGGSIPLMQRYSNLADIFAFAFWQLGHPDYQPK